MLLVKEFLERLSDKSGYGHLLRWYNQDSYRPTTLWGLTGSCHRNKPQTHLPRVRLGPSAFSPPFLLNEGRVESWGKQVCCTPRCIRLNREGWGPPLNPFWLFTPTPGRQTHLHTQHTHSHTHITHLYTVTLNSHSYSDIHMLSNTNLHMLKYTHPNPHTLTFTY